MSILIAMLAVGSDATEWFSQKTQQHFLGKGYWEGVSRPRGFATQGLPIKLEPGKFFLLGSETPCQWIDEGGGQCRMVFDGESVLLCLYKREDRQMIICVGHKTERPTRVHADEGQGLYILKPSQPPKK